MKVRWIVVVLAVAGLSAARAGESELDLPVHVMASGEPLDVGGIGYAAPYYADFNGDGVRDLLVGEFHQGRMRIYRNVGSNAQPRFEDHVFFQDGAETGRVPAG